METSRYRDISIRRRLATEKVTAHSKVTLVTATHLDTETSRYGDISIRRHLATEKVTAHSKVTHVTATHLDTETSHLATETSRYGEGDGALEGDACHRDPCRFGDVASRYGDGDGAPEVAARCAVVALAVPGSSPGNCLP